MDTLKRWWRRADDKVALLIVLVACVPLLAFGLVLKLWQRKFQ